MAAPRIPYWLVRKPQPSGKGASCLAFRRSSYLVHIRLGEQCRASILSLLGRCRPAAIIGRVISGSIYPIKRHAPRRLPHIREKIFERLPSLAYGNAASTILVEACMRRAGAAPLHALPRSICAASWRVNCRRVSMASARNIGCANAAPARSHLPRLKPAASELPLNTAIASGHPIVMPFACARVSQNNNETGPQPNNIFDRSSHMMQAISSAPYVNKIARVAA